MKEDINRKIRRKQITIIVLFLLIVAGVLFFITNYNTILGDYSTITTEKETRIDDKIGEKIRQLVAENPPLYIGWFTLGVGIFVLMASVFNWDWIFRGHSYNSQKIEGISNIFGRGVARVYFGIGGIICIILGIILIIMS